MRCANKMRWAKHNENKAIKKSSYIMNYVRMFSVNYLAPTIIINITLKYSSDCLRFKYNEHWYIQYTYMYVNITNRQKTQIPMDKIDAIVAEEKGVKIKSKCVMSVYVCTQWNKYNKLRFVHALEFFVSIMCQILSWIFSIIYLSSTIHGIVRFIRIC